MSKLTASLLTLSALTLSACDLDLFEFFGDKPAQQLKEGNWNFKLDQIEFSDDCMGMGDAPESIRMHGHISYFDDHNLEIELDGLLLLGSQEEAFIYAEAAEMYDYPAEGTPVCEGDEDEDVDAGETRCVSSEDIDPLPGGMYVYLDGEVLGPRALRGELVIESSELGETCIVQARYRAEHIGGASSTPGEGEVPMVATSTAPSQ